MNYTDKYLKYKNKYLAIKNQYGNGIEKYRASTCHVKKEYNKKLVNCEINFTNSFDTTCWVIAILMIFLLSDSTSKCVQHKLYRMTVSEIINNNTSNMLLNYILPDDIMNNQEQLISLIEKLQQKFYIKVDDYNDIDIPLHNTPSIRRQFSNETEKEFTELYFNFINDTITTVEDGGASCHEFFLINILSCLFLQRLITIEYFFVNNLINTKLLKNTIGILVHMNDHTCAFYICNNKMKFCSDDFVIDYNWISLFNTCNKLKLENKDYKIYLNMYGNIGPFIYVDIDNTIILFNNEEPLKYIKSNNLNFNDTNRYKNIVGFNFLCYSNIKTNLKKIKCGYYLQYYTYVYNIEKYREFIIKNNIVNDDIIKIYEY